MRKKLSNDLKKIEKSVNELTLHYDCKNNRLFKLLQNTVHEYLVETIIDEEAGGTTLDQMLNEELLMDVLEEIAG